MENVTDTFFGTKYFTHGAEMQLPRKVPLRIEPKSYFGELCGIQQAVDIILNSSAAYITSVLTVPEMHKRQNINCIACSQREDLSGLDAHGNHHGWHHYSTGQFLSRV